MIQIKKNKKFIMALSFCLGALMLVTTAFADITSKSGYDLFKDTVKSTFKNLSENTKSFTYEAIVTLKNNDQVLLSTSTIRKVDNANRMEENATSTEYSSGKKRSSYSYRDSDVSIFYEPDSDTYYVDEYPIKLELELVQNPFKEDRIKDLEKIVDALVGNLKNHVIANEKDNGAKEFSGTLNEGEIPPLVNAISSFLFRTLVQRDAGSEDVPMPQMEEDIFIKQVAGKASTYGDGTIESLYGTFTLSGKDKDGNTQELCFEVLLKIYDINSTVVEKPDLTGKKVQKREIRQIENIVNEKFIGKYKSDVVIEKDGRFVKIGERIVEITKIDDKRVVGRYSEVFKEGYEDYQKINDFTFDAEIQFGNFARFEYIGATGEKENGIMNFDQYTGKIYFQVNFVTKDSISDMVFYRVFDE